jgi:inhibitor of KinA
MATRHGDVIEGLRALLDKATGTSGAGTPREVQVCYDGDFAPDLDEVARQSGLSPEEVVKAHLSGDYSVYLYGFAPGYAYMAGVHEAIRLPRKPAAKRDVPAGSVIIAGPQCLVTTLTMPTGWWIIGRSPTKILTGDPERPFLFDVGDPVRFARIDRAAFDEAEA